jgi:hypothetical protein
VVLEDELRGGTVVLERTMSFVGYDIRRVDASGAGVGEPIAKVMGGTRISGYGGLEVFEGDRLVVEVARKSFGLANLYVVVDGDAKALGTLQHGQMGARHWDIADADGNELGSIERRSPPLLFVRQLLNWMLLAAMPLPYRYALLAGGVEVGSFRRKAEMRRRYLLDLTLDPNCRLSPLLALAAGIQLAELEEQSS